MKIFILIIGKKSFIGSNLKNFLSKYYNVKSISYEQLLKRSFNYFKNFNYVINTTIHNNYIKKKYNYKYDLDRKIIENFKIFNCKYVFLNSRKIYKPGYNLNEKSSISPQNNYSKNKVITENYLKKKLNNKLISLRISNIVGRRLNRGGRINHRLFLDNFIKFKNKDKIIKVNNDYKDFISIDDFVIIIKKIINKKIFGVYNVSLGKKIYISEITKWLDIEYHKKIIFKKSDKDSFTLSNKKLLKKININMSKKKLEFFCRNLKI